MDGCAYIAGIDGLPLCDFAAHHVDPFRIVNYFFWNQKLTINQAAKLAENLLDTFTQSRRLQ